MPLPLPNLDTRRWADLVEEGRALIPRYAPQWSDHNVHDPGITLIELFAWLIEADIYRTNRVPPRHRRKFLQLIGFTPRPPTPARVVLRFVMKSGGPPQHLPAGLMLSASTGATRFPFRLLHDLVVIDTELAAVQAFDGKAYADYTRDQKGRFNFSLWGPAPSNSVPVDPTMQPALYLGFSKALPVGRSVSLWFRFAGPRTDSGERQRIMDETQAAQAACRPIYPIPPCPPMAVTDRWCPPEPDASIPIATTVGPTVPFHQSIRTAWEYWDGATWWALDSALGEVLDETRGFTLDGSVTFKLPTLMGLEKFGVVKDKLHYLRCRLVAGPLDYLPTVLNVEVNAVPAEQAIAARGTFMIRPGVLPAVGQEPQVGALGHLDLDIAKDGAIVKLAFASTEDSPEVRVITYEAAKASVPGKLTVTLVTIGHGTGLPGFKSILPDAPVVPSSVRLWTLTAGKLAKWTMCPDLDASGRTDAHFVLGATTGEISFGDGERGRVVPLDATILASFDTSAADNGNVSAGVSWRLIDNNDDGLNLALLGVDPKTVADALSAIENPVSATGGADEEDLEHAAGRAAEVLWAHERLLELGASTGSPQTLDGLDRNSVLARAAPARATTLLDYERIALDVPGAPVARARAWAGLDPGFPCLKAPGTVVVIVVPRLPAKRPMASPELLEAVRRYLDRRRLVGTRLVVVGPQYLEVTVRATLAVNAGARSGRVLEDVRAALDSFLDPLSGGPNKGGWPFGRDVYRSEILEVIDEVAGVDHVENLELVADANAPQCGNLCVGPLMLVTPGTHMLKVAENLIPKGGAHACTRG
jgi:hypothetical protein